MVRYHSEADFQTKALWGDVTVIETISIERFSTALFKRLLAQRFPTHHSVTRVTSQQFMAMLAYASLKKYF